MSTMKAFYLFLLLIFSQVSYSQVFTVKGSIKDENGMALKGAVIHERGTNNKVISDSKGLYAISVRYVNGTLVASGPGFSEAERMINGQGTQDFVLRTTIDLGKINVIGTRNMSRSAKTSPASVETIDIPQLSRMQGQFDVNQLLQFALPSFDSNRQSGADGADHVDPSSVHGLSPDEVLVMINGKRRNESSMMNIFGSRGRGSNGFDLNSIPIAAIKRIEILKDGAAAQYGSNAIGGVINVVLKDSPNEFSANVNGGLFSSQYRLDNSTFDGLNTNANITYGMKIAKKGFVNITGDYNFRNYTNRAYATELGDVVRREYGDPRMQNASLYYNMQLPIGAKTEVYSFGGVNYRMGDAYAWTRFPKDSENIASVYPKGFDPIVSTRIDDREVTAGIRTKRNQWDFDLSNTIGFNKNHFFVSNSLNRSLGELSQHSFESGGTLGGQNVANLTATRHFSDILKGLNFSAGAEYRLQWYEIFAGERPSYYNYDPGKQPGGAQGFPGFSPANALRETRSNYSSFVDIEADLTKKLAVTGAARYDYYTDFGSTVNGKVGLRYSVSEELTIRASVGTGFKAPSMSQKYFNQQFSNFDGGTLVEGLVLNDNNKLRQDLKIPDLKPENSQNANIGIVLEPVTGLTFSLDGYYIKIKDRIILTDMIGRVNRQTDTLFKKYGINEIRFFSNGLSSTTTMGIDASIKYVIPVGTGNVSATLAGNYNHMEIGDVNVGSAVIGEDGVYFSEREKQFMLTSAPQTKFNLTFNYALNRLGFMVRLVRFGEISLINWNYGKTDPATKMPYAAAKYTDVYAAKVQTDISASYSLNDTFSIILGGSNILGTIPDRKNPSLTESGGAWDAVQMGNNGGFFFTKIAMRF